MECLDEFVDVGAVAQRQRSEHEPRGPSFGSLVEQSDRVGLQPGGGRIEEPCRFLAVEAKILGPDLGQLIAHAKPTEPERRVDSGRDHDREVRRPESDELLDAAVHVLVGDEVVVVDDQDDIAAVVGDLIDDAADHSLEAVADRRPDSIGEGGHRFLGEQRRPHTPRTVRGRHRPRRSATNRDRRARASSQPLTSVDFPEPAGALTSTTPRPASTDASR